MITGNSLKSEKFIQQLDPRLIKIINLILSDGFELTLVGGCVRDFLKDGVISDDFDFEIRFNELISSKMFFEKYEQLILTLKNHHSIEIEALPFSIYRLRLDNVELEISIPRLESYSDKEKPKKHSEFKVLLDHTLIHEKAFLRRDFSINSMGILFINSCSPENLTFIDPFNGIDDLKRGILKSRNPDFYLDPVRFLRTIRFQLRFDYLVDKSIKMSRFNLQELTFYYLEKENDKLCDARFFREVWKYIEQDKINISENFAKLQFLKSLVFQDQLTLKENIINCFKKSLITVDQLLILTSLNGWKKKPMMALIEKKK